MNTNYLESVLIMIRYNINKVFMEDEVLLESFELCLKDEVYLLTGKNGSGKTTLLNMLYRLHVKYYGNIYLDDVNINEIKIEALRRKHISYVFQSDKFFNNLSIKENILIINKKNYNRVIQEFMEFYDLSENESIKNLSGGQRQLLNLIIHLNKNSEVFLIDEPFNNLDKKKQLFIKEKILKLNKTVIIVDHKELIKDNVIEILNKRCLTNV